MSREIRAQQGLKIVEQVEALEAENKKLVGRLDYRRAQDVGRVFVGVLALDDGEHKVYYDEPDPRRPFLGECDVNGFHTFIAITKQCSHCGVIRGLNENEIK